MSKEKIGLTDEQIEHYMGKMHDIRIGLEQARTSSKKPTSYSEEEYVAIVREFALTNEEVDKAIYRKSVV